MACTCRSIQRWPASNGRSCSEDYPPSVRFHFDCVIGERARSIVAAGLQAPDSSFGRDPELGRQPNGYPDEVLGAGIPQIPAEGLVRRFAEGNGVGAIRLA